MYQARAHRALVQGTIKPGGFADVSILRRLGRPAIKFFERHGLSIDMGDAIKNGLRRGRCVDGGGSSEQPCIAFQGLVQAQHQLLGKRLLALALGQFLGAGLGRQGLGGLL